VIDANVTSFNGVYGGPLDPAQGRIIVDRDGSAPAILVGLDQGVNPRSNAGIGIRRLADNSVALLFTRDEALMLVREILSLLGENQE